jgi:hypothetical protein
VKAVSTGDEHSKIKVPGWGLCRGLEPYPHKKNLNSEISQETAVKFRTGSRGLHLGNIEKEEENKIYTLVYPGMLVETNSLNKFFCTQFKITSILQKLMNI